MLTFLQAKEILARHHKRAGTCVDDPTLPFFVKKVLQQMLFQGTYGNLRKFCFMAVKGCFTIPAEIETIEKLKIDNFVGQVWDRWYDFHASAEIPGCVPVNNAAFEDPNYYSTVYDVPEGGARIGCMGTCNEVEGAHLIVQGIDPTGREIMTFHNGQQVSGEYLSIKNREIRYTQATFAKITGITKPLTNGYVNLLWVDLVREQKGFLADYSPLETTPTYRRYRLTNPQCPERLKVSCLARIRLKDNYADNDIIPFENIWAIDMAGQMMNSAGNKDMQTAGASGQLAAVSIENENSYKKPDNGQPMEVYIPLSGGSIPNINGGGGGFTGFGLGGRGWWRG